jgi:hypothetical protein
MNHLSSTEINSRFVNMHTSRVKIKMFEYDNTLSMNTKLLIAGAVVVVLLAIFFGFFMKKEKFVGDFSIDSGFYAVDHDQFGGSGILEDPINQSRM